MKLLLYCLLAILLPVGQSRAQSSSPPIRPLTIGDTIPEDLVIENVTNYSAKQINFSEISEKIIIFDFISSTCLSCIRELPKLDSLQRKYKGQILVLLISSEPFSKFKRFYDTKQITSESSLPFIYSDSILNNIFPHTLLPHKVWIESSRKVIAITESNQLNEENIQLALNKGSLNIPMKVDLLNYDYSKNLLEGGNGGSIDKNMFRSVLTRYLPGMASGMRIWTNDKVKKITWLNRPILKLYQDALGFSSNRVILEVEDTNKYLSNSKESNFSYELTIPNLLSQKEIGKIMTNDLNDYLNLNGRMEIRKENCYALQLIDSSKVPISKNNTPFIQIGKQYSQQILNNHPLSVFTFLLNYQTLNAHPTKPIIIDETNLHANVDLMISINDPNNLQALNEALLQYGLTIQPAIRDLEVFVLSENKNY